MTVEAGESGPLIVMSGEADLATADQIRDVLTAQLARGAVYLTIDVAGLTFADSGTISIFTGTAKTLRQLGGGLVLLRPQSNLLRVLKILGADKVLTFCPGAGSTQQAAERRRKDSPLPPAGWTNLDTLDRDTGAGGSPPPSRTAPSYDATGDGT